MIPLARIQILVFLANIIFGLCCNINNIILICPNPILNNKIRLSSKFDTISQVSFDTVIYNQITLERIYFFAYSYFAACCQAWRF